MCDLEKYLLIVVCEELIEFLKVSEDDQEKYTLEAHDIFGSINLLYKMTPTLMETDLIDNLVETLIIDSSDEMTKETIICNAHKIICKSIRFGYDSEYIDEETFFNYELNNIDLYGWNQSSNKAQLCYWLSKTLVYLFNHIETVDTDKITQKSSKILKYIKICNDKIYKDNAELIDQSLKSIDKKDNDEEQK